jgi:pantetheine-phosphate adenylyltransferase
MKTGKAVYAASLDPITCGHQNIIERAVSMFDELVVMISSDAKKQYLFTVDERANMARVCTAHIPNVTVDTCINSYTVKKTASIGASVLIRGIRNGKDADAELLLAGENNTICSGVQTILLPCHSPFEHISSSMVKGHVGADPEWEWEVARLVSPYVQLKEKYIVAKATKYWGGLVKRIGDSTTSPLVFENIVNAYSGPQRAYHNLEHIVLMLDEYELVGGSSLAVECAIWFHDIVYDSASGDNEAQSALYAKKYLLDIGADDTKTITDLDLMILGTSERLFERYEQAIRAEYSWVPQDTFVSGRTAVLESFLNRHTIYNTAAFKEKYEQHARTNIKKSLLLLK